MRIRVWDTVQIETKLLLRLISNAKKERHQRDTYIFLTFYHDTPRISRTIPRFKTNLQHKNQTVFAML